MSSISFPRAAALVLGTLGALGAMLATACRERVPTAPGDAPAPASSRQRVASCEVNVPARTLRCVRQSGQSAVSPSSNSRLAASMDRIVGGQDIYVKLTSANTVFDAGAGVLSSDVSVQNLARFAMGTTDGLTVSGVRVFFQQQPTVTAGSGSVAVLNADGTDTFTGTNQPYFAYTQIIRPYEISSTRGWQFSVSPGVITFIFTVYVDAPMTDETGTLLDRVWTGTTDGEWLTGTNWRNGAAPDSTSTVAIPIDTLLASGHHEPQLSADATIANLRIGSGNTLDLNGHTLTAMGNVDAIGAITNGTVTLTGSNALVGGTFAALQIDGIARTQRATTTTRPVSVTGALSVVDQPLSIQIP